MHKPWAKSPGYALPRAVVQYHQTKAEMELMKLSTAIPNRTALALAIILTAAVAALTLWPTPNPAPNPAQAQTLPVVQFELNSQRHPEAQGNTDHNINVVTDQVLTQAVTVSYQFTGTNTATENQDYRLSGTRTLTIPAGSSSTAITVTIIDDDKIENIERFKLRLFNPTGATLGGAKDHQFTISDTDESRPIRIDLVDAAEVSEGAGKIQFHIIWDPKVEYRIVLQTIAITLDGDTATDNVDFESTTKDAAYNPGDQRLLVEYDVYEDTLPEEDETFSIDLLRNGVQQKIVIESQTSFDDTFTILDNDVAYLNLDDININFLEPENQHSVQNVEVTVLLNEADKTVSVDYATEDITATPGRDYTDVSGTLHFAPGEREKSFNVPIMGDNRAEDTERLRIRLSDPAGAELGPDDTAQITISDSDPLPTVTGTATIGREGSQNVVVTLTPSIIAEYRYPVSIRSQTGAGTATEGADFQYTIHRFVDFRKLQESATTQFTVYDDSAKELPESFEIQVLSSETGQYQQGPNDGKTTAWIIDDDNPAGFVVTLDDNASKSVRKKHVGVPEGGSKEYQIWLTEPPTQPVTVNRRFTGSDSSLTSSSPASHTFNDNNWNEPYRVTLEAAQDSDAVDGLARIHRRDRCCGGFEGVRRCSLVSGIMVLKQETDPREGAPFRCYHLSPPTASASPLMITAWWPMPGWCCPPPWPGVSVFPNWLTGTWIWARLPGGPTPATS